MLVTWPDPAALVDSYALLKVLRQRNPVLALSLIANGVESESEAERLHARVDAAAQRFLGRGVELQGWVPRDPNVSEASAGQVPICLRQPASPASRAIDALARSLIGETKGSLGTTLAGTFASSYATRELLH